MEQPPQLRQLPPRFYTEQFWKELAEEWRGKVTDLTASGICFQAAEKLRTEKDYYWKICDYMKQYAPEHIKNKTDYFWPACDESRPLRAELCERIAADMKRLMETPTPIWRTPEFWRKLAEEWRGPETFRTTEGICGQLVYKLIGLKASSAACEFLEEFRPSHDKAYFFPIGGPFRPHRAELCERIATHLEHEANQAQTSSSQGPTTT